MKIKYCLPIVTDSKKQVIERIENNPDYDYFEIWLDYIDDLDELFVKELITKYDGKLVFLFRRLKLEAIKMGIERRMNIISILQHTRCYLDLDVLSQSDELEFIKEGNLDVFQIVSYHNYKETPSTESLDDIIDKILDYHPIVVKISTFCNKDTDAMKLMVLLLNLKTEKYRFIVLGMGDYGKITRVFGMLKGNAMNYAPRVIDESSAPGQIEIADLEEIAKIFSK